jgi:NAD(P)-dependent dehydrogenase (short-subunit alcohol dehydrogenase family)
MTSRDYPAFYIGGNIDKTGRVAGKVALITGAARGQGRSHAVRLAEEGADVIVVDLPDAASKDISRFSPYPMATEADLEETARLVTAVGGSVLACQADVRDQDSLDAADGEGGSADHDHPAGRVDRDNQLDVGHEGPAEHGRIHRRQARCGGDHARLTHELAPFSIRVNAVAPDPGDVDPGIEISSWSGLGRKH